VSELDWLAVGEGLIGFALGLLTGTVWVLVHACGGWSHGRHVRRE
jgi:hypothetical protein